MAYIGAEPAPGQNRAVDDISSSFNGSTTAFTLQVSGVNFSPESANNILVSLGGVMQKPGTDYTIAAATITFTTAPASGLSFWALILGDGIDTATVADQTIGPSKLLNTAVTAGSYTTADITVDAQGRITAAASGSISGAEIADGAVTNAKVNASAAIDYSKLATLADGNILVGNGSGVATSVNPSGDIDISNTGAFSIASGAIVNADVNASAAIAVSKLATFVNTNADNRVITGSGTANTLNGESNLTVGANADLHVKDSGNTAYTGFTGSGDAGIIIGNGTISDAGLQIRTSTSGTCRVNFGDGDGSSSDRSRGFLHYRHTANSFGFGADASERMTIISSGFVGIGQGGTSYDPGAPLEVRNPAGTTPSSGSFTLLRLCAQHNSNRGLSIGTGRPTSGNQNDGGVFYNAVDTEGTPSGYSAQHVFQRAGNNVMVIGYQGGNVVGIGTDTPSYKIDCHHAGANTSNAAVSRFRQTTNNQGEDHTCFIVRHAAAVSGQNGVGLLFQNSSGTAVGKIDFGQSTTQYRTSSDYRLKENEVAISDGITRLKTLKPYRFNFIAEPDRTVDGFFAHEVTAVPEAISGTKDEVETTYYEEGDTIPDGKAVGDVKSTTSPVYQGIDQSKLVPLLTAALQEAIAKIEVLETKVAALEAA